MESAQQQREICLLLSETYGGVGHSAAAWTVTTGGLWMADNRLRQSDPKESYLGAVEFSAEGLGPKWSLERSRMPDVSISMQISMQNQHLFIWLVWPDPY